MHPYLDLYAMLISAKAIAEANAIITPCRTIYAGTL